MSETETLMPHFGCTSAEVEEARNDRKWRILRWILFVAVSLLWLSMLISAILLVIFDTHCPPKVEYPWWHNTIIYQVWTPSFQDSDKSGLGDFLGIMDRLENIRRLGANAVWPTPILYSDDFSDAIIDHTLADPKLGSNDHIQNLIKAVHDKDMKFVMTLPITFTSKNHDWFSSDLNSGLTQSDNMTSYYIWRLYDDWNDNNLTKNAKINNFYSEAKRDWDLVYMHHENQPNLPIVNWENDHSVIYFWIEKGVDAFYLKGIEYLALDHEMKEVVPLLDILVTGYEHRYFIVLFSTRENASAEDRHLLLSNGLNLLIDYEAKNIEKGNHKCDHDTKTLAHCVHEIISDIASFHTVNNTPAIWEFGNPDLSRIASRIKSQSQAELLTLVQLLLQGTCSIYYGEEIGMLDLPYETAAKSNILPQRGAMQWDDTTSGGFSKATRPAIPIHPDYIKNNFAAQYSLSRSHLKTFRKLANLRSREQILSIGNTHISGLVDNAFVITRFPVESNDTVKETTIFIGVINFGKSEVLLPVDKAPGIDNMKMRRAIAIVLSSKVNQYYYRQEVDLSVGSLKLFGEQGVVFKILNNIS